MGPDTEPWILNVFNKYLINIWSFKTVHMENCYVSPQIELGNSCYETDFDTEKAHCGILPTLTNPLPHLNKQ